MLDSLMLAPESATNPRSPPRALRRSRACFAKLRNNRAFLSCPSHTSFRRAPRLGFRPNSEVVQRLLAQGPPQRRTMARSQARTRRLASLCALRCANSLAVPEFGQSLRRVGSVRLVLRRAVRTLHRQFGPYELSRTMDRRGEPRALERCGIEWLEPTPFPASHAPFPTNSEHFSPPSLSPPVQDPNGWHCILQIRWPPFALRSDSELLGSRSPSLTDSRSDQWSAASARSQPRRRGRTL